MSKIFISYRHVEPDAGLAAFLKTFFAANGHEPFVDTELQVGDQWAKEIEGQLRAADVFIVLLSNESILSNMVRKEIALAFELAKAPARTPRILPIRVGFDGALPYDIGAYLDPIQYFSWVPGTTNRGLVDALVAAISRTAADPISSQQNTRFGGDEALLAVTEAIGVPLPAADPRQIAALESGTLTLGSGFYVRRDSDDSAEHCLDQITPTTIVQAPRQMGKSSLLVRMHAKAAAMNRLSWYLDFQLVDEGHMKGLDKLFRHLARRMQRAFGSPIKPNDVWDENEGPKGNLTDYLEDAVLKPAGAPVQIILDEVDRVFNYSYRGDFFATIRGWHNQRATNPTFEKLTIVMGHATAPALWINDMNQSPFNVGFSIKLRGFLGPEIVELSHRHGLRLDHADVKRLIDLLGGHPYLTRLRNVSTTLRHQLRGV